jgi:hypothetical protein
VNDDYDLGVLLLIEHVRWMNQQEHHALALTADGARAGVTLRRNELMGFAKRLDDLANDLDQPWSLQSDIECEHDKEHFELICFANGKEPRLRLGPGGYPIPVPRLGVSYAATLWHMRLLADSAKLAADSLPNSRVRTMLPLAAMALLHLRFMHGLPEPKLGNKSADVQELKSIFDAADVPRSLDALRGALSIAAKKFYPFVFPPGVWEIIFSD